MKIILIGEQAFFDVGSRYMLCIGTKAEVEEATPERLVRMIWEAVAWSKYRSIEASPKVLH